MARDVSDATPIESRDDLIAWIASGEKPASEWRIGTEHEKVPFYKADLSPVPYEGGSGIRALLEGLAGRNGWVPILEDDHPIGLADETGGGAISLEPGGQFELSGAPLTDAHATAAETARHLEDVTQVAGPLGIGFLNLGMSPLWGRSQVPVMPKRRYEIMAGYMPKVGSRGLDMMFRTATAQVNLDFGSEADMVRKMRVALALQPVATALFANSPWFFEHGAGYESYVDWALDVPMYFVKRGEVYHDVSGASFRDLLAGRLAALPGERATLSDWANHLSTLFPEVRLKRYLEMRGADMGPQDRVPALAAFWAGLLYDGGALDAAWDVVRGWSADQRQELRDAVPRQALAARIAGRDLKAVATEILAIAAEGLSRRARLNAAGQDERIYLTPLQDMAASGETLAEHLLRDFKNDWDGALTPAFQACAL